ncbi:MAG: hypothetical protein R3F55_12945 [Alphaproteobacteria bacterium]
MDARGGVAALAVALMAIPATAGAEGPITLSIVADGAGTAVDLTCTVTENGTSRQEVRQGPAPMALSFAASAIQCTIDSDGAITVEARLPNGSTSRSQTSGGQIVMGLAGG